jgi:hypothetical protein
LICSVDAGLPVDFLSLRASTRFKAFDLVVDAIFCLNSLVRCCAIRKNADKSAFKRNCFLMFGQDYAVAAGILPII